jgi:thiamine biosynthesis lipoprotein
MTSEAPACHRPDRFPSQKLIPVHKPFGHKLRTLCGSVFACCMLACVALLLTGFDASLSTVLTGETMGTSYRLVLSDQLNESEFVALQSDIDHALNQLEDQMSTWRPESELSRFNSSVSTDWFPISRDTAFVVSEAKRIWKISDGAFDPTVASLIKLWHFAEDPGEQSVPSDFEVEQARAAIGFGEIDVRLDPPALLKKRPELQLNLSAIAKGYAVDVVSKLLTERVSGGHLVEIPDAFPRQIYAALPLDDQSLATSGDYRNYFEVDEQRYSHTIDPATGRPVTHNLTSVSVLAEDCLTADALATVIEVLGPERGMELAKRENVAIYQIVRNDSDFDVRVSASFPSVVMASPSTESADESDSVVVTVLAAIGVFALAIAGMAVGVIFSNRAIKGSCGGLANMPGEDGKSICEVCTVPAEECRDEAMRKIHQQAECSENGFEV